jgi:hypothetical protein
MLAVRGNIVEARGAAVEITKAALAPAQECHFHVSSIHETRNPITKPAPKP